MADPNSMPHSRKRRLVESSGELELRVATPVRSGHSIHEQFIAQDQFRDADLDSHKNRPFVPVGCEVVERAGCGSFSEVWKIRDITTGKLFALKQLPPEWKDKPVAKRILKIEARVGIRIQGEHVVRIIDDGADDDRTFFIMEWLEGVSLEQKLHSVRRLPESSAVWIARQCAQGLLELARFGFAHGDLKPQNIFVTSNGNIKLIDLGFAKPLGKPDESFTGKLLTGTAEYMAPESLSSETHNPSAKDIYSLGITLFRMLAGRLPLTADNSADILKKQKQSRPPRLRRFCPSATRQLTQLVNRMLAKQPIRRPTNLSMLVRELIGLSNCKPCRNDSVRKPFLQPLADLQ
jgi:serine/threonine protein kinase